jgi:hypothetical protein
MTTTAETNYGSTLKFNSVDIPQCQVLDWPEISTGKASITNHNSGGFSESLPNGLITIGDQTLSIICDGAIYGTLFGYMEDKLVAAAVLVDGQDTFTGTAFIASIKKEAADAQNPNAIKATVVIAWTGSIAITDTVAA